MSQPDPRIFNINGSLLAEKQGGQEMRLRVLERGSGMGGGGGGGGSGGSSGGPFVVVTDSPHGAAGDSTETVDGTDDTTSIQSALDDGAGGTVFFPEGGYSCEDLNVSAGTTLLFASPAAILKQRMAAGDPDNQFLLNIDSGDEDPANNVKGVTIIGGMLRGTVDVDPHVTQHIHLIRACGVTDFQVYGTHFKGFRGDAIYLQGNDGDVTVPANIRHNQRVKIYATGDGINNDNRNFLSVIDCDDLIFEGTVVNCTRPNMPGAIDFEPNPGNTEAILRHCRVRGHFDNIGGTPGVVGLFVWDDNGTIPEGQITDFDFQVSITNSPGTGVYGEQAGDASGETPRHDIRLHDSYIEGCATPWYFDGIHGGRVTDSSFVACTDAAYIGYHSGCRDIRHRGNDWIQCAENSTNVVSLFQCSDYENDDYFYDCGKPPTDAAYPAGVITRLDSATVSATNSGSTFTLTGTGSGYAYTAGDPIQFAGTLPSPLVAATTYYIAGSPAPTTGPTTFQVAATPGGAAIALTGTGSGMLATRPLGHSDNLRMTPRVANSQERAVSVAANVFGLVDHGYVANERVLIGGVPPAPLVTGTAYFIRYLNADQFELAYASSGAVIPLTDAGTNPTVTQARTTQITSKSSLHVATSTLNHYNVDGGVTFTPPFANAPELDAPEITGDRVGSTALTDLLATWEARGTIRDSTTLGTSGGTLAGHVIGPSGSNTIDTTAVFQAQRVGLGTPADATARLAFPASSGLAFSTDLRISHAAGPRLTLNAETGSSAGATLRLDSTDSQDNAFEVYRQTVKQWRVYTDSAGTMHWQSNNSGSAKWALRVLQTGQVTIPDSIAGNNPALSLQQGVAWDGTGGGSFPRCQLHHSAGFSNGVNGRGLGGVTLDDQTDHDAENGVGGAFSSYAAYVAAAKAGSNMNGRGTFLGFDSSVTLAEVASTVAVTASPTGITQSGTLVKVTATGHGLITGDGVTLASTTGGPAGLNTTWTAARIDDNNFTLDGSVWSGSAGGGGTMRRSVYHEASSYLGYTTLDCVGGSARAAELDTNITSVGRGLGIMVSLSHASGISYPSWNNAAIFGANSPHTRTGSVGIRIQNSTANTEAGTGLWINSTGTGKWHRPICVTNGAGTDILGTDVWTVDQNGSMAVRLRSGQTTNPTGFRAALVVGYDDTGTATNGRIEDGIGFGPELTLYRSATNSLRLNSTAATNLYLESAVASNARLIFTDTSNAELYRLQKTATTGDFLFLDPASSPTRQHMIITRSTGHMQLQATGDKNLGIGGVDPTAARLQIAGTGQDTRSLHILHEVTAGDTAAWGGGVQQTLLSVDGLTMAAAGDVFNACQNNVATIGATTSVKGSLNAQVTKVLVQKLQTAGCEFGYFQGLTRDETTTGTSHGRLWGQDLAVHGYAGNEQQEMLNNIVVVLNNHYNGSPSAADSSPLHISTGKNKGPEPHNVDTYAVDAGMTITGNSTLSGVTGIGFTTGIRVGGGNTPWFAGTGDGTSRIGTGIAIQDFASGGLKVWKRTSGSTGAAIQIGLDTTGAQSAVAADGIAFGTDTNLFRSAADILKTDDAFIAAAGVRTWDNDLAASRWTPANINAVGSEQISTPNATTVYVVEVFVGATCTMTGIELLAGSAVPAGETAVVMLWNSAGTVLANSATAGTALTTSANAWTVIPFTGPLTVKGPGRYFVGVQYSAATANLLKTYNTAKRVRNSSITSNTFGTIPTLTPPTTVGASLGPTVSTY